MSLPLLLGLAWGGIVAAPIAGCARRVAVRARLSRQARPVPIAGRLRRAAGPLGRVLRDGFGRRAERRLAVELERELPAALDLMVVAVGAGATPAASVALGARWAPSHVGAALARVVAATRLGGSLVDALAELAGDCPALAPLAEILTAGTRLGAPASAALIRLADEARAGARRRAETRARTLPVKLLFPLVFLVLPAFGLLTVAPALLSAMSRL